MQMSCHEEAEVHYSAVQLSLWPLGVLITLAYRNGTLHYALGHITKTLYYTTQHFA